MCVKKNLEDSVFFLGIKKGKELVESLQIGDAFVTASKSETFCLSVLEAMACGLPVVAVGKKGVKELVRDGENGFLSFSDAPKVLMEGLNKILHDKKLGEKFALNSRKIALKYSRRKIVTRLRKIYDGVGAK